MHTLKTTAVYVKTRRAPKELKAMLTQIKRVLNFPQERANRLVRFIEIVKAYQDGASIAEIESEYRCTKSTILRYARIMGLPKRPRHFEVSTRERVVRLYRQGIAIALIAERCGVSQAYVSKTATEENINRRQFKARD